MCVSVKSHLTSRMSNQAINERAYLVAYECQKICGDLHETTGFKSYAANTSEKANMLINRVALSPLNTQRSVRSYPTIVNNIQPCPTQCLLMPLAHIGARTDSTTHTATTGGVADFRTHTLAYNIV